MLLDVAIRIVTDVLVEAILELKARPADPPRQRSRVVAAEMARLPAAERRRRGRRRRNAVVQACEDAHPASPRAEGAANAAAGLGSVEG
jgi:hypothetical protein